MQRSHVDRRLRILLMGKLFSLVGVIGLLVVAPAKAALIYDSITGTTIVNLDGYFAGDQFVGNSFTVPSGSALPYVVTLGLGAYPEPTGGSAMVYLAADA